MTNKTLTVVGAAAILAMGALHVQVAQAQLRAGSYVANFARAYDECVSGNAVTVVNPGGIEGCPAANVTTDSAAGWKTARLRLMATARRGTIINLRGSGFVPPAPTKIGLQLTLRTTNAKIFVPPGTKTFEDQTIICGTTTGSMCGSYFAADVRGRLTNPRTTLNACLTSNNLNNTIGSGNIEILEASLVNCDTGLVFATSGIIQN